MKACTTDEATNQILNSHSGTCNLQVLEQDYNQDKILDNIRIQVAAINVERVTSAAADIDLVGLLHVEHSSPTSGGESYTAGVVKLEQQHLPKSGTTVTDKESLLFRLNASDPYELGTTSVLDVANILHRDYQRGMRLSLWPQSQSWKAGAGYFRAIVDVHIPESQSLIYRPRALTELKYGFIQWLGLFVAFSYIFSVFEAKLFHLHTFDTFCTWDSDATERRPF